nr:hypothetical protein [Paenisporosarcina sp. TG20]
MNDTFSANKQGFLLKIRVSDCSVGKNGVQVGKMRCQVGIFGIQVGKNTIQVGIILKVLN